MCSRHCSCSDPPRHHVNTQIASLGRELHWSGPGVDSAACDDRIPLGSRSNYKVETYEQQTRFASPVAATALPRHAEGPHPASALFSPKETYDNIVAAGVSKAQLPLSKQVTLSLLGGFYVSFSFMLCLAVGGRIPDIERQHPGLYNFILGAVGFPLGLTVIMVAGGDLFTSSTLYMTAAWVEGRVATYHLVKAWLLSWWCNLAACIAMAQLAVWAGLFEGSEAFPIALAERKTAATFGATVVRGVLCNWLVNLGVWLALAARDLTGKAVGVYLPVSAFVTLGTEQVIANQFELTLAKMLGSGMSLRTIVGCNFAPATIGNIIGGAFFVAGLYAGVYGTLYDRLWGHSQRLYGLAVPCAWRPRLEAAWTAVQSRCDAVADWLISLDGPQAAAAATPDAKAGPAAAPPAVTHEFQQQHLQRWGNGQQGTNDAADMGTDAQVYVDRWRQGQQQQLQQQQCPAGLSPYPHGGAAPTATPYVYGNGVAVQSQCSACDVAHVAVACDAATAGSNGTYGSSGGSSSGSGSGSTPPPRAFS